MQAYLQYRRIGQAVRQRVQDGDSKINFENNAINDMPGFMQIRLAPTMTALTGQRAFTTIKISSLAFIISASSSILAGGIPRNSAAFGVSEVVASIATGLFLLGFTTGSLISSPLSEVLGRNLVYVASVTAFMIFTFA
ncbi:uncharacterized protein LDX57_011964 [Aspergillus melleus]|uniref:uncharacterized protein n=1 Tax=Aspergillus melleus TaxID=138277 RepID=UPI001E8D885C|nr:uncharacterized protein LDX57_011964 [Aspergillus melleus]KAH8434317.1 hypothetical protein LDX57_011964 [Aspergillus melleus]